MGRRGKLPIKNKEEMRDRRHRQIFDPYHGYRVLPTSALPQLPPFHYSKVILEGKVTHQSSWNELDDMRDLLKPHHMQELKMYPQIGNFLHLNGKGNFNAAFLHHLMIRVCKRESNLSRYEFWFLINGKPIRFGAEEFSLVSGLRFCHISRGDAQHIKEGATLKNRRFSAWGNLKVPVGIVKEEIKRLLALNDRHGDILKLFYVWVISAILFPECPKVVENFVFNVCDNLDICERYGWGHKVWRVTVEEILGHLGSRMGIEDVHRWNAHGFPFIIMYWMLEAIQGMPATSRCYSRLDHIAPRYPRMLRWEIWYNSRPDYEEINRPPNCEEIDMFFDRVKVVIPRLQPDEVESISSYYTDTKRWFNSIGPDHRLESYRILSDGLGDDYVIVKDDEGHPVDASRHPPVDAPRRPPTYHPVREAGDSKRRRVEASTSRRRADCASTAQSRPTSMPGPTHEELPAWRRELLSMEERLTQRLIQQQVLMEHRLVGRMAGIAATQTNLQMTMARLEQLISKDLTNKGINLDEEEDDGVNNNEVAD